MFPGFAVQNGSGVSGNGEIGKSENRSIGPFVGMAHGKVALRTSRRIGAGLLECSRRPTLYSQAGIHFTHVTSHLTNSIERSCTDIRRYTQLND